MDDLAQRMIEAGARALKAKMEDWHGAGPADSEAAVYAEVVIRAALRAKGYVVVPVPVLQIALLVMTHARDLLPWSRGFVKDFDVAIGGIRAMLAAQEAPDATVRISAVTLANLADAAETQIIGSYPNAILYPPQRKAMEAELAPVREAREALRAVTDCSTAAAPRRP